MLRLSLANGGLVSKEAVSSFLICNGKPGVIKDGRAKAFHNARAVTIPNAGHWVQQDQLDHFRRVVKEFLTRSKE